MKSVDVKSKSRSLIQTCNYGLVICRNPYKKSKDYGKWLSVKETLNRGWWLPGGALEEGESFKMAALRECREEAGIEITLKGILKIDHGITKQDFATMRVIFYAEPTSLEMCN